MGYDRTSCIAVVNLPFNKAKLHASVSLLTALNNQNFREGENTGQSDGVIKNTIKNRRNRRKLFRDGWLHTGDKVSLMLMVTYVYRSFKRHLPNPEKEKYVYPWPIESLLFRKTISSKAGLCYGLRLPQPVGKRVVLAEN